MNLIIPRQYSILLILSILLLFVFYFGLRFSNISGTMLSLTAIPVAIIAMVSVKVKKLNHDFVPIIIFFVILSFFGIFDYTPNGLTLSPGRILIALVMISCYLIARFLVYRNVAYPFTVISFWIVALPSIIIGYNGSFLDLNNFFTHSSVNYVSSWLVITSVSIVVAKYYRSRKLAYIPLLTTIFISFSFGNRSSVAVSILSLFFVLYIKLGFIKTLFAALLSFFVLYVFFDTAILELFNSTKFSSSGLESPRWEMLNAYISNMNISNLLIGTDLSYIYEINTYNNNPHNSFIKFHSRFGIVSLFIGFIYFSYAFRKSHLLYTLMCLIVFLRVLTDTLIFGSFLDIFLMIIFVAALEDKKTGRKASAII